MDVTWIPGSADLLVIIVASVVAVGAATAVIVRGRRQGTDRTGPDQRPAPRDGGADPGQPVAEPRELEQPSAVTGLDSPETRLSRLRSRLSGGFGESLLAIFRRGDLSASDWDELEEVLLAADVGVSASEEILGQLRIRLRAEVDTDPRDALREVLIASVDPDLDRQLRLPPPGQASYEPVIVVGVNGVGKTTTVGKLARVLVAQEYTVVLGAADTFRAAAADQLHTWGARVGVPVIRADRDGADPASVAFDTAAHGRDHGADVVLIDTAGRLQNKAGLMDELGKIVRVVGKVRPCAEVLLVLDATTGQNGLAQARVFAEAAQVTGIVLTKLDGSAKGGIVIAVQRELGVPVKFIGLGEGADDLAPFEASQFVDGLLGR